MATQPRSSSEVTPSIGVVPYSTTVASPLVEVFDSQHHSSFTISIRANLGKRRIIFSSSALEKAKVKKFGLDLIKLLVRRSRVDHNTNPGTSRRYDEIFGEHVENESKAQRRAKPDIPSRPATPFPVPDVKKHGGRQADWKKRFVAMKSKHAAAFRDKRSSLKIWLTQFDKGGLEVVDGKVVSSKDATKLLRKKKSMRLCVQEWSSRSTTGIPEMPKEPETCFSSTSLASSTITTDLTQFPKPPPQRPQGAASTGVTSDIANATSITPPNDPTPQRPERAASTGSLRTQISYENNLAVPARNEKPTHPSLRTRPYTRSNPTLGYLEQIDEKDFHPSLRTDPFTRLNPPPLSSETHILNTLNTNNTTSPAILSREPPTLREKTDLVRSLNIARSSVCAKLLDLHPLLRNRTQEYAGIVLPPLPPPRTVSLSHRKNRDPLGAAAGAASTAALGHARQQRKPRISTTIEVISFGYSGTANGVRLVSPPGLGGSISGIRVLLSGWT